MSEQMQSSSTPSDASQLPFPTSGTATPFYSLPAQQEFASAQSYQPSARQITPDPQIATPFHGTATKPPFLHLPSRPATSLLSGTPSWSGLQHPLSKPHIREAVERYRQWLQMNNQLQTSPQKIQAYRDAALKINSVGKREVCTYAPFQEQTSALTVITTRQVLVLTLLVSGWILGLLFLHMVMITLTLSIVTILYICGFLTSSMLAMNSFGSTSGEKIDEEIITALDQYGVQWPSYTILCPLYKEVAIAPQFVEAMKALSYPQDQLQVLFLTEENDSETRNALYEMGLPANFTILTVPAGTPQTKPRACNFGLLQAKGQFIVIFDAEDQPETYQLKKAILTFANHGAEVACVQAKLNYYNSQQNILTRWFTAEYSSWFDIMLPGLQRSAFSLPLGGTSNHFRTEVLRALGGWDAFNVTEDCDLGLRISQYGLKTAVLDSTTYEEATSRFKVWIFQRSRWIKGYLQTYLVHMRHPSHMLRRGHFRKFFSLQLIVGAWTLVLLINPIMWTLTICYFLFRPVHLYSLLFPGPILYMGAFCLIFGNFFYIYIHIIGCLRRKEYSLIKWVLLIPLYWIMMSISAYIAFYQLIVKPHYWEKTQHGNHLVQAAPIHAARSTIRDEALESRSVVASMPTSLVFAVTLGGTFKLKTVGADSDKHLGQRKALSLLDTTTQRVTALRSTLSSQLGQRSTSMPWRLPRVDGWLQVALVIATIASIAATTYNLLHHQILLYGDAYFHLRIARRMFDSATPGIGQLGTTWLPLPHLLMLPFVWNDYLWRTGLAGSIPAMICYLLATLYLFLSARRLTHNSRASFIATLLFIINPNILYLQSTPLSELVCIATLTIAGYYFLAWIQDNRMRQLTLAAAATCLATMARYDGWALFGFLLVLIPVVGCLKRHKLRQIEGNMLIFLTLGGLGIVLWLLYNLLLTGSPLYFLDGPYSSKAQTLSLYGNQSSVYTYHNLWQALRFYAFNSIDTIGMVLCVLALLALVLFVIRKRPLAEILGVLAFLAPFGFYVLSLYRGEATLAVPGAVPSSTSLHNQLFNARFGSEMVVPVALFLSTLLAGWQIKRYQRFWSGIGQSVCIVLMLIQTVMIANGGIITVEDGAYGVSCEPTHAINLYLARHYNGGRVLEEMFSSPVDGSEANFDLKNIIWEGSYQIWPKALAHPEMMVDWIILNPKDPSDQVAQNINTSTPAFHAQFEMVVQEQTGLSLYHKIGQGPLPTHPIPGYLLTQHQACDIGTYGDSLQNDDSIQK